MKNVYKLLSPLLFLCTSNILLAQVNIDETIKQYRKDFLPEKVFVHTDKNIYAAGETVWMAVYLMDAQTHITDANSLVVRVELQDRKGTSILSQKLYAEGGHMNSEMTLPKKIEPGDYQLAAYTNYQRNGEEATIFRKVIHVVAGIDKGRVASLAPKAESVPIATTVSLKAKEKEEVNFKFFPEGGDCINGISCRMSVVVTNAKGKPMEVKGGILDELGQEILSLETDEFGIGNFVYVPKEGKRYQVELKEQNKKFDFPSAMREGYHLRIGRKDGSVVISLQTNKEIGLNNTTVLIRLRGEPIYLKKLTLDKDTYALKLPTESLLPGVYVVTLFDGGDNPTAERLFFVSPDRNDYIDIQTDTLQEIKTQQQVDLNLRFASDFVSEKYTGRMSLSVLPSAANTPAKNDKITTWLLLNSDLDQPVPFYAELMATDDTVLMNSRIDDFLRTRCWRRFVWKSGADKKAFIPKYELEKGIYLQGKISDTTAQEQKVVLTRYKNNYVEETTADAVGNFTFGPYEFSDTLDFLLQSNFDLNKKTDVKINLSSYSTPFWSYEDVFEEEDNSYKMLSHKALNTAYAYDSLVVKMDTVQQKMRAKTAERSHTKLYNDRPDARILLDTMAYLDKMTSVVDVIKRIPGVIVSGEAGAEKFQVKGASTKPTYYLNGFKTKLDDLRELPLEEIKSVDIIRGPKVAAFGTLGENGVVLVYTKESKAVSGMLYSKMTGFHKTREFAVFDSEWLSDQKLSDIRTTLHWNPDLRANDKGEVKETFTTSDQTGEFIIVVQGLRDDGTPFYGTKKIVVEK